MDIGNHGIPFFILKVRNLEANLASILQQVYQTVCYVLCKLILVWVQFTSLLNFQFASLFLLEKIFQTSMIFLKKKRYFFVFLFSYLHFDSLYTNGVQIFVSIVVHDIVSYHSCNRTCT